jgi:hypothetical protein
MICSAVKEKRQVTIYLSLGNESLLRTHCLSFKYTVTKEINATNVKSFLRFVWRDVTLEIY